MLAVHPRFIVLANKGDRHLNYRCALPLERHHPGEPPRRPESPVLDIRFAHLNSTLLFITHSLEPPFQGPWVVSFYGKDADMLPSYGVSCWGTPGGTHWQWV